jgi:hypothetical protein
LNTRNIRDCITSLAMTILSINTICLQLVLWDNFLFWSKNILSKLERKLLDIPIFYWIIQQFFTIREVKQVSHLRL